MEQSIKPNAVNYGLYLGGAMVLFTIIAYAVQIELLANLWYGLSILLVVVVFGVISAAKSKQILGGFISFKNSFTSYFITVLIGLLISLVVSYLLFNFIDPEAAETLKNVTIENQVKMMKGFNTPNDIIAETVEVMEQQDNYSFINILKGLAGYIVMYSIIGLIVAAVMKKNTPDAQ
ncbi:MAG: DUF4199 domain-containing protein [Flavobacteriaceae bacterium]|nr:DUF4199 domain-containing protein [Flavobacteriaceae bacterium]